MHRKNRNGYWITYRPDHPYSQKGGYIPEHHLVMEEHLGRYLVKGEDVHHINGNRKDNRIENLKLMTHSDHTRTESTGRKASEETKQKLSLIRKGRHGYWTGKHFTEEHKMKLRLKNIGRKHTEEAKDKIGIAHLGNTYGRANKGKSHRGHKVTEETKEKIRLSKLGKPHPHKGTRRSEEAKRKMSISKIGNTYAKKKG